MDSTTQLADRTQARGRPTFEARVADRSLVVGVVGLGYAGLPLALGFAQAGFGVLAVERDPGRVRALNSGKSYVEGISDAAIAAAETMLAVPTTTRLVDADVITVCVPTPLSPDGEPDLAALDLATAQIAPFAHDGRTIVIQSTVPPGSTVGRIGRFIQDTEGYVAGVDYHLVYAPERINPGDPAWGLANTPRVVAGMTRDCLARARMLFEKVCANVITVESIAVAELTKLFENTFRLVNIALANELSDACGEFGVQPQDVIAAAATKPYGFLPHWPGPGIGGDCIPVDPVFLAAAARSNGRPMRMVELAHQEVVARPAKVVTDLADRLGALRGKRVLVAGVAYKPEVADIRNAPGVAVLRQLLAAGVEVAYSDPHVPTLAVDGTELASRPWSAVELAGYDCVVLTTEHKAFASPEVWAGARQVHDSRGRLPESDTVRPI